MPLRKLSCSGHARSARRLSVRLRKLSQQLRTAAPQQQRHAHAFHTLVRSAEGTLRTSDRRAAQLLVDEDVDLGLQRTSRRQQYLDLPTTSPHMHRPSRPL
eukprot:6198543-Pleurochrysis_carterae.AAC.1